MHSATIYLLIDAQSSNTNTTKICSFLTFTSIKQEIMVQLHFIIHIPSPPPISVLPWFSSFTCSRWESLKISATCFNGLDALPATSSIRALTESQCTDRNQGKLPTGLILVLEYCGKRCCSSFAAALKCQHTILNIPYFGNGLETDYITSN